jgi:hypothetical protein
MKMTAFWDIAPCSLVEVDRCFKVLTASIIIAMMMKAVSTSEMLVNFYETTRHNIPEGCHLLVRRHENLKSYHSFA